MKYKTKQKELVYNFFLENAGQCVTAAIVKQALSGNNIGLTTIYRVLQQLQDENVIRKYIDEHNNSATYEYIDEHHDCDNHYHLRCSECGTIIHLECSNFQSAIHHIEEDHDFIINPAKSTLYGVCKDCHSKL